MKHCIQVIDQGERDTALVVRSEVVKLLETVHKGSEDTKAIERLQRMFSDSRNLRAGKPLYIQKQILYAIRVIGGKHAVKTASNMAKSHPDIASYYSTLDTTMR